MDEAEISTLVTRLARPHPSGGLVVERAALLAAGADFPLIMDWILAHGGVAEIPGDGRSSGGLHGMARSERGDAAPAAARRFVLPAPTPLETERSA
jgi:hypothetical protein